MASTKRLIRSFYRLLLPTVVLIVGAGIAASVLLIHSVANPQKVPYMVTPEKYGRLSTRAAQVTEESWNNQDGTSARGWLLRGTENSPAVILLHRYGADRSWILDLGVKINEATNFTVLMPDMRGHGENPPVKQTTLGGCEADDVRAALEFLRGLQNAERTNALVGKEFGIYGVEMGALSGLNAAARDENIKALVLDSAPASSNDLISNIVVKKFPVAGALTSKLAVAGTYGYSFNSCYNRQSLCAIAKSVENRKILLLSGGDVPNYQDSMRQLANCLPDSDQIESKLDLATSGYGINNASLEQSAAYDQRVIEFFKRTLGAPEPVNVETVETPVQ